MSASTRAALVLAATALLSGCGARTVPGDLDDGVTGGDASGVDAQGGGPGDAGAGESGLPCGDTGPTTVVYALDGSGALYRYDPPTGQLTELGVPDCGNGNVPWTMTATTGHAYIVYTDWSLYVVDLATLTCSPTAFQPGQLGLDDEFGVAAVGSGDAERIYYYGEPTGSADAIVAVSDTVDFELTQIADIPSGPSGASFPVNLTADAFGHLYAFSPLGDVQEIDQATGAVLRDVATGVTSQGTWATIAYGSDLYLWVQGEVVGYDLAKPSRTSDLQVAAAAIGAGSFLTCP